MIKKELNKIEIGKLLFNSKIVGQGTYGLIVEYDDNTLIKIYYKDIFETYHNKDITKLDEEIILKNKVEKETLQLGIIKKNKLEEMKNKIKQLETTKSSGLIKGLATYNDCLIGVFLEYYKEYEKLSLIFDKLNKQQQEKVLKKSGRILGDLFKHGIFPRDIKEDNILVRKEDLDIKLIDLDDIETRYENKEYIKEFPYIKKEAVNQFIKMKTRLKKEKER